MSYGGRTGAGIEAVPVEQAAPAGVRCGRCRMRFRAGPPAPAAGIEWLRCPDCGRRFWADPHGAGGRCAVGIAPPARPAGGQGAGR